MFAGREGLAISVQMNSSFDHFGQSLGGFFDARLDEKFTEIIPAPNARPDQFRFGTLRISSTQRFQILLHSLFVICRRICVLNEIATFVYRVDVRASSDQFFDNQ